MLKEIGGLNVSSVEKLLKMMNSNLMVELGTCYECSANNQDVKQKVEEAVASARSKYDTNTCQECGGQLRERSGPYGRFMGCCKYPACSYKRKVRN